MGVPMEVNSTAFCFPPFVRSRSEDISQVIGYTPFPTPLHIASKKALQRVSAFRIPEGKRDGKDPRHEFLLIVDVAEW